MQVFLCVINLKNRVGTGFDDNELIQAFEYFKPHFLKEKPKNVFTNPRMKPDFWLPPLQVWEIGFQDFTQSPSYIIGKDTLKTGISVRFPKIIKKRTDKNIENATTVQMILDLYMRKNPKIKNNDI